MSGRGGQRLAYTAYEKQRLVRMVEEGLDYEIIGERLGRAPEGLRNLYGRITGRIPSRADRAQRNTTARECHSRAADLDQGPKAQGETP